MTDGVFEFLPSYIPRGKSVDEVRKEITAAIRTAAPSYGVFSDETYDGRAGLQYFSADPAADERWLLAVAPMHHVPLVDERAAPPSPRLLDLALRLLPQHGIRQVAEQRLGPIE